MRKMRGLLEEESLPLALRGTVKIVASVTPLIENVTNFEQNQTRLKTLCEKRTIGLEWKFEENLTWPEEI